MEYRGTHLVIKKNSRGFLEKPLVVSVRASIFPRAVDRNKIKRRIKAIFRNILGKKANGFTVIVKKEAAEASFKELFGEISHAIKIAGITKAT